MSAHGYLQMSAGRGSYKHAEFRDAADEDDEDAEIAVGGFEHSNAVFQSGDSMSGANSGGDSNSSGGVVFRVGSSAGYGAFTRCCWHRRTYLERALTISLVCQKKRLQNQTFVKFPELPTDYHGEEVSSLPKAVLDMFSDELKPQGELKLSADKPRRRKARPEQASAGVDVAAERTLQLRELAARRGLPPAQQVFVEQVLPRPGAPAAGRKRRRPPQMEVVQVQMSDDQVVMVEQVETNSGFWLPQHKRRAAPSTAETTMLALAAVGDEGVLMQEYLETQLPQTGVGSVGPSGMKRAAMVELKPRSTGLARVVHAEEVHLDKDVDLSFQ